MLLIPQIHLNFEVTTVQHNKKIYELYRGLEKRKKRKIYIKRNTMPKETMYHNVKPSIKLVSKGKTINPII